MKLQPVSNISSYAEAKEKVGLGGLLSVLFMVPFTLSNCFIGPGLGLVIAEYGEAAQQVITIPSLLALFCAFIGGALMQKMPVRKVFLIAGAFNIIGGIAPVFINGSLTAILATRVIYGIGFGLAFPCAGTITNLCFAGEFKDKLLGFSTFFTMAVAFIFGWMSAALMNLGWKGLFWGYLIFVPMYLLAYFKMPNNDPGAAIAPEKAAGPKKSMFAGIKGIAIFVLIGTILYNIAIMATSTNLSNIMLNECGLSGTACATASNVALIGQMIFGLFFATFHKIFKNFLPSVAMIIIAAGVALLIGAQTVLMFCIAQGIIGLGYGMFNPAMTVICNDVVDPDSRANMMGLYSSCISIGQFLTVYALTAICGVLKITGSRGTWIAGCGLVALLAVISAVVVMSRKKKA